jgi:hypothetical protein
VGDESAITHLLIDIRHACDNLDLDFYQLLDNSHHHYSEEVTPEGIEEAHAWLSLESLVDDVLPTAVNQ